MTSTPKTYISQHPHILLISHSSARNGAPILLYQLTKHLIHYYTITVLLPSPGPTVPLFTQLNCTTITFHKGNEFKRYSFWSRWKLKKLLKQLRPNLVTANSIGSLWSIPVTTNMKIPTILYIHELLNPKNKKQKTTWQKTIPLATHICCGSRVASNLITTLIPDVTPTIVHPGIPFEEFSQSYTDKLLRTQLNLPENTILIGTVATICPNKGTHYLIDAGLQLLKEYPNLHFIIIGALRQKYQPFITRLKQKIHTSGYSSHFHFLGEISNIPHLLHDLDIFIHPSLSEAYSMVIMEAMASGLPVIATSVGGTPEQITHGENGLLIPPGDVKAIIDTTKKLLHNRNLIEQLGKNAFTTAQKKFNITATAQKLKNLIEDLICNSKI